MFAAVDSWAVAGGSISGSVLDASGAMIPGATVKVTNIDTRIERQVTTNDRGFYSVPDLPVGPYDLWIEKAGFKPFHRSVVTIDTTRSQVVDAVLEVGLATDAITVMESAIHAETSDTQVGEVVRGAAIAAVPLNGRSYTDLLALQPGVVPATSLTSNTVPDLGASAVFPSGDLNPGTISINGQRELSNAFVVNGSDAEEDVNAGAAIIPNLDSVAESRILSNNSDAEYGAYSGGQINVVTKSGTNQIHGDASRVLTATGFSSWWKLTLATRPFA